MVFRAAQEVAEPGDGNRPVVEVGHVPELHVAGEVLVAIQVLVDAEQLVQAVSHFGVTDVVVVGGALDQSGPLDAAAGCRVGNVGVDAGAAEADERFHPVLACGLGEASQRASVSRASRDGRGFSASQRDGLVVDAGQRVGRLGAG